MSDKFLDTGTFNLGSPIVNTTEDGKEEEVFTPVQNPRDVWADEKQPWASTMGGRLAIRSVSRGILGSAFYAIGGYVATRDMQGYDPNDPKNAVQQIARVFDVAFGRPIARVFGDDAVSFRPTLTDRDKTRTLGEDVIDNTFNFAMATAGDALGRNIVGLFDPSVKSKWRNEEGKISIPKAVKSTAMAAGRIFEAQMEDWFVAVPYAYQKKAQRKIINHFSPGFEYDADRGLNGSSFKVDENGKVVGTYTLEGAIDLQGRFTGYNIGTMIYRDGMKSIKNKIHEMHDEKSERFNVRLPTTPKQIMSSSAQSVGQLFRYGIKSSIKAGLIMTPSVPVFWTMRNAQAKHRSIGLGPDGKPLLDLSNNNIRLDRANAADMFAKMGDGDVVRNPFANPEFDPYGRGYGPLDTFVNPFGKAAFDLSNRSHGLVEKIAEGIGKNNPEAAHDLAARYVNGTMAYTPYIYTKNEFGQRWDNQQMDSAIYHAIDGFFGLNFKEMRNGVREIRQALKQQAPDVVSSHPETVPENYDRDRKGFVSRIKHKGERKLIPTESTTANWQNRVQDSHEPDSTELPPAPSR